MYVVEQRCRSGLVADLVGRHEEPQGAAVCIGDGMELDVHAAFGAVRLMNRAGFAGGRWM